MQADGTKNEVIGSTQRTSPQVIAPQDVDNLMRLLAIFAQSGQVELSLHPITHGQSCSHSVILQLMNVLRRFPSHLPRQIIAVKRSTGTVLIDAGDIAAKEHTPLQRGEHIEFRSQTNSRFGMQGYRCRYAECRASALVLRG